MKTKYLLSALLGSTMLAACSVDDVDLTQTAQDVNPSAPVFTVSFDNGEGLAGDPLTRAQWVGGLGNKVSFDTSDLLSLYHGMNVDDNWKGYQNAIYYGSVNNDNQGNATFTYNTRAMVNAGHAIMIYPADTEFKTNYKDPLAIAVPSEQVKAETKDGEKIPATKELTPYMSEVLNIEDLTAEGNGSKTEGVSGYDKKYDIVLRRAASTLGLTLEIDPETKPVLPEGIPDLDVNDVTLSADKKWFTTKINLKINGTPAAKSVHESWIYSSDLDVENGIKESEYEMTTTDVDKIGDNRIAYFTLLPTNITDLAGAKLVLNTTYGTVTIEADEAEWKNPIFHHENKAAWENHPNYNKEFLTVSEALNFIQEQLWVPAVATNTTFNKNGVAENIGQWIPTTVKIDMSKVDMNGMHIKAEDDLMVALAVYNALNEKKDAADYAEVTLILDGGQKGNADGEFTMSQETWEEVVTMLDTYDGKLHIAPCGKTGEVCNVIKLTNNGAANVPVFKLESAGDYIDQTVKIHLAGKGWTYENTTEANYGVVTKLVVLDGAELTLKGSDTGKDVNITNTLGANKKMAIDIEGKVIVDQVIRLVTNTNNYGTIDIANTKDRLRLDGNGVELINYEDQDYEDADATGGIINNAGTLTIVEGSGAKIINYGTINIKNATARTLITTNDLAGSKITEPFSSENKFGTIWLEVKDAGLDNLTIQSVSSTKKTNEFREGQGFVKYYASEGCESPYANYIILQNGDAWPESTTYIEIAKGYEDEINIKTTTATAVRIPTATSIFIPRDETLTVTYMFLEGFVTRAGVLKGPGTAAVELNGYFGDSEEDHIDSFE